MKRFLLSLILSTLACAQDAPPKMLVYPRYPLLMPYLKKCTAMVAYDGGPKEAQTAPYILDSSATGFRYHGTLYNHAGEALATFDGLRSAPIAKQICNFFEGLKEGSK